MPGTPATTVYPNRGLEVQVVRVEAENAQQPRETCEIASNDLLQVRYAPAAPVLELTRCE